MNAGGGKPAAAALPPGSTLGIIGGGQLGRMLAMAAARIGYRVHVYAPEASGPAADVCARWVRGDYADEAALARFCDEVDRVTYEFENLPVAPLAAATAGRTLHPPVRSLDVAQDRAAEKRFLQALDIAVAPWAEVTDAASLAAAVAAVGAPAILKTARFGYDGKGQARIDRAEEAGAAWAAIGGARAVMEARVAFDHEYSLLLVRAAGGEARCYPPTGNEHRAGILHRSTVPAPAAVLAQAAEAERITRRIADALDHVGMLAVEFFAGGDGPVVNELAPRVHNSGHWTIEGAACSQFENHVRAVCGLPLGATHALGGAEMVNLIGDDVDRWGVLLADADAHLHLYGKHDARPGRKMGHVTRVRVGDAGAGGAAL